MLIQNGNRDRVKTVYPFLRRKPQTVPKWYLLLLIPIIYIFILLGTRTKEERNLRGVERAIPENPILVEIRSKHLFPYNPSRPTNYTDIRGHKNWKQTMSKMVAQRLNYKKNGFFLECGALDGVFISNSLLLEKSYNWTGLLIEADPFSASILKGRNRKSWVSDVCLSPNPFPMEIVMTGHQKMSDLSYIQNDVVEVARKTQKEFTRKFQVQCYPLEMLMGALNRTEIDYFSLDVEGVELDILKTIPFDRIHIKLIGVEVRPGNKQKIQDFLRLHGYKRIKEIKIGNDYIHDDLYEFIR